jgi:hypothetical protein
VSGTRCQFHAKVLIINRPTKERSVITTKIAHCVLLLHNNSGKSQARPGWPNLPTSGYRRFVKPEATLQTNQAFLLLPQILSFLKFLRSFEPATTAGCPQLFLPSGQPIDCRNCAEERKWHVLPEVAPPPTSVISVRMTPLEMASP